MTTLLFNSSALTITSERIKYNQIRLKYQALAEEAATRFSADFATTFKNIDDVHNRCTNVVLGMLRDTAELAVKDLVALGIYDIDLSAFEEYLAPYFDWDEEFAAIDDKYLAIVLKAEELDAYRTQRRQSRGRWVGGGFGFGGAVKGAMQAGAMNLATGAVHGLFNLTAKGISAVGDAMKKQELYANPATKETLVDAVYRALFSVHLALIDAANASKPGTYSGYVSAEDQAKATRLLDNIDAGRVPTDATKQVLLDAFSLDPYNEHFYRLWLTKFDDASGDLEKLEAFFGLSVSAQSKHAMIQAHKATLDFSSPEACDASLPKLQAYAKSIGYTQFDKERQAILATKATREQERRTVDGVTYPSDQAAAEARDAQARTVKGVTYHTHAEAEDAKARKSIGVGFYLALACFPYITPFFTLRKGYSNLIRGISFAWMICFYLLIRLA